MAAAPQAPELFSPWPLSNVLQASLDRVEVEDGLILEFGVYSGETVTAIARKFPDAAVYGFDSFEGLPEDWHGAGMKKGAFDIQGRLPAVPENVTLVKGWFDATLPAFLEAHPGPVTFCHVDSDLYSSAAYVLAALAPRLRPGSVVCFDEIANWGNWIDDGEWKALAEFEAAHPDIEFEWLYKGDDPTVPPRNLRRHNAEQAALRILRI